MQYTVLGSSGFIGRNLIKYLDSIGCEYYAPDRHLHEIMDKPLGHVIYCIGLTADFRTALPDLMGLRYHINQ